MVRCCRFSINCIILRQINVLFVKITVSRYALTSLLLVFGAAVLSWLLESIAPFPMVFFRFPMNIILMALWLYGVVELYRRGAKSVVARYLLSVSATVTSIFVLAVGCIVMGLQRRPATDSYLFLMAILFALTQLTMVTLRGWRNSSGVRWLFLLCHAGLLLVLAAGFWGAPDKDVMRMRVTAEPSREMLYENGSRGVVDYTLALKDLRVEYYSNGTPSSYEADVEVADRVVTLSVNHPYRVSMGEHIYLTSVDEKGSTCIVQLVRQPWQKVTLAGIVMLIAGAVLMFLRGPRR